MVCEHLRALEKAMKAANIRELSRGRPWSDNCREWVTFDCFLDRPKIRRQFKLDPCVEDYANDDPRSGKDSGLECRLCHDAIVGVHPDDHAGRTVFPS